nr:GGDEF domain-containing protein [Lachnospiraceae bacterium]
VLTILLAVCIFMLLDNEVADKNGITQDQPYDVTVGDEHYANANLADLRFYSVKAGTKITYTTNLKGEMTHPLLRIYTQHSRVKVFLDDSLLYDYGNDKVRMFGYGYLTVALPFDYTQKTLTVEQTVMESGEVSMIKPPVVYQADSYLSQLINAKRLYIIFDFAMLILSLSFIIVSIIYMQLMPEFRNLVWLSVSFFGMGLWVFCSGNLIGIFAGNNLGLRGYLEYLSLYISPAFFLLYFYSEYYKNEKSVLLKRFYIALLTVLCAFPAVALILHFTDIIHLPRVLTFSHISLIILLTYALFMLLRQMTIIRQDHMSRLVGMFLMILVSILDLANFFIHKYTTAGQLSDYSSILLLGLFLFAICMIVDFFATQKRNLVVEAKSQTLEKIAYEDMMTHLSNRHKCDSVMSRIAEKKQPAPFGILNFDLNNLKKTNDEHGHMAGDRLITDFADILSEVFSPFGTVGRMGGDEFIVIFEDLSSVNIDMLLSLLEGKTKAKNETRRIPISYAVGYAVSDDERMGSLKTAGKDAMLRYVQDVYRRADLKMYADKTKTKANQRSKGSEAL